MSSLISPPSDPSSSDMPLHVAIIMDGNGRWASARGLPRTMGHRQGAKALKTIVRAACDLKIEYLTLFGFSSENWSRPKDEVSELLRLMRFYLRSETAELIKNNIQLKILGDITAFDATIQSLIRNAEDLSAGNTGLKLNIAINYGGRADILQAAKRAAEGYYKNGSFIERECGDDKAVQQGARDKKQDQKQRDGQAMVPDFEALFEQALMTAGMPDPDLLIRTSGEQRISNFLLWQCAYSELVFTDTLWPDFSRSDLEECIEAFKNRDRRFGGLNKTTLSSS